VVRATRNADTVHPIARIFMACRFGQRPATRFQVLFLARCPDPAFRWGSLIGRSLETFAVQLEITGHLGANFRVLNVSLTGGQIRPVSFQAKTRTI